MRQRGISEFAVRYAHRHGKRYNRSGAEWMVLRNKDIPKRDRDSDLVLKCSGVVVCIENGVVATVYWNDRPSIHIRRKSKYSRFSTSVSGTSAA